MLSISTWLYNAETRFTEAQASVIFYELVDETKFLPDPGIKQLQLFAIPGQICLSPRGIMLKKEQNW